MKYFDDYIINDETWEKQSEAGRYNPALEITYKIDGKEYTNTLGAGTSDNITVMVDKQGYIYVLTENRYLDYMGLEIFKEGENLGDMFLEGSMWDMTDIEKINFLHQWVN